MAVVLFYYSVFIQTRHRQHSNSLVTSANGYVNDEHSKDLATTVAVVYSNVEISDLASIYDTLAYVNVKLADN